MTTLFNHLSTQALESRKTRQMSVVRQKFIDDAISIVTEACNTASQSGDYSLEFKMSRLGDPDFSGLSTKDVIHYLSTHFRKEGLEVTMIHRNLTMKLAWYPVLAGKDGSDESS